MGACGMDARGGGAQLCSVDYPRMWWESSEDRHVASPGYHRVPSTGSLRLIIHASTNHRGRMNRERGKEYSQTNRNYVTSNKIS